MRNSQPAVERSTIVRAARMDRGAVSADEGFMRALSIRQPWAELILRGIKTIEYRSRPTRIVGERFWIYASKGAGVSGQGREKKEVWSSDVAAAANDPPP